MTKEQAEILKKSYPNHIYEIRKDIKAHKERERLIDNDFTRKNYDRKLRTLTQVLKETEEDYQKFRDENAEYFI